MTEQIYQPHISVEPETLKNQNFYTVSKETLLTTFQSSLEKGLSKLDIAKRQKLYGINKLPARKKNNYF